MKRTSKFLFLCLSLTLIVGAALGISVSATETEGNGQIDILAQNVVYGEKVSVAYAVDASVEDAVAGKVKVSYYLATEPSVVYKAELRDTTVSTNLYTVTDDNGTPDDTTDDTTVSYPVFATLGFAPQDFTDVVFAVAYTGDSVPEGATYKEYSVAEYLYSKLYKDGFINKTETDIGLDGKDYKRKVHYENMMAYGASAQDLIDGETETLITDYCYLYTEKDSAIKVNGVSSTLVAPGTEVTFSGSTEFILNKLSGETEEITSSYTAKAGEVIKITGAITVINDFEDGNITNSYVSHTNTNEEGTGAQIALGTDPENAANKVLEVVRYTDTNVNATTTILPSNSDYDAEEGGMTAIFETKMYVEKRQGFVTYFRFYGTNSSGTEKNLMGFSFQVSESSNSAETPYIVIRHNGASTSSEYNAGYITDADGNNVTNCQPNQWVTIRMEYYRGASQATTYTRLLINGEVVFSGNYHNSNTSLQVTSVKITHDPAAAHETTLNTAYYDDMYLMINNDTYPDQ